MSSNLSIVESFFDERFPLLERRLSEYLRNYPYGADKIIESAMYSVGAPGRRWRSFLFLTIYEALSRRATIEEAYAIACSIEYIHTASIILDDLPSMDGGTLRRGRKPCYLEFSPALAILTSFFLCDVAQQLVHEFGTSNTATASVDLDNLFRSTKNEMMRGQILDLQANDKSPADVIEKYRLKSGALYALAACAPAHMLGLIDIAEKLRKFGSCLGIAYQISDDISDQTCDTDSLSKNVRQDGNKSTIIRIHGINAAATMATFYKRKSIAELKDIPVLAQLSELVEKICPAPNLVLQR